MQNVDIHTYTATHITSTISNDSSSMSGRGPGVRNCEWYIAGFYFFRAPMELAQTGFHAQAPFMYDETM